MVNKLLGGLLNNKSVLNSALGMIRSWMEKDGISAVVIARSDDENSETPGLSVKSYPEHIGIVTGAEDNKFVADMIRLRDALYKADAKIKEDESFSELDVIFEEVSNYFNDLKLSQLSKEKEATDGV